MRGVRPCGKFSSCRGLNKSKSAGWMLWTAGGRMHLRRGDEAVTVSGGEPTTRMQARETKASATGRRWEIPGRIGRDFRAVSTSRR